MNPNFLTSFNQGGLFLSPAKAGEYYDFALNVVTDYQATQIRKRFTSLYAKPENLKEFIDYIFTKVLEVHTSLWITPKDISAEYGHRSILGNSIKPQRILQKHGFQLPIFLPDAQNPDTRPGVGRGRKRTATAWEWLRAKSQPLALLVSSTHFRMVYVTADSESYIEWDLENWFGEGVLSDSFESFHRIVCRQSLLEFSEKEKPVLVRAIEESRTGETDVSEFLGEKVRLCVEALILHHSEEIANRKSVTSLVKEGLATPKEIYRGATRVIMRLVVLLFAESRTGLLPLDSPLYRNSYSLVGLREELAKRASADSRTTWPRLLALFRLIYDGSSHKDFPIPRYRGEIFQPATKATGVDAAISLFEDSTHCITDAKVNLILRWLTQTKVTIRQGNKNSTQTVPVDFSSFRTEYIGILYEGLLDYELRQAPLDSAILFLNRGDQPAVPFETVKSMQPKPLKELLEKLGKSETKKTSEEEDNEEDAEEDEIDDNVGTHGGASFSTADDADNNVETHHDASTNTEDVILDTDKSLLSNESQRNKKILQEVKDWLKQAVLVLDPKLKLPKNATQRQKDEFDKTLELKAQNFLAREIIQPGEWYLVRWGGTRKGSGTFYTKPGLGVPTVRKTLEYLVKEEEDGTWKKPDVILKLKVCDPACGSGSFLISSLRYLAQSLWESLLYHKWIIQTENGYNKGDIPNLPQWIESTLRAVTVETGLRPVSTTMDSLDEIENRCKSRLRREIVEHCIYGVDLDPLAVELARIALWIETMDPELPFEFLDHKIKCGNSLVGAWLDTFQEYPILAWEREGGDKGYTNFVNHYFTKVNQKGIEVKSGEVWTRAIAEFRKAAKDKLPNFIEGQSGLFTKEEDILKDHLELQKAVEEIHKTDFHNPEDQAEKFQEYRKEGGTYSRLKKKMDLWCALWFWNAKLIDKAPLPDTFLKPSEDALSIATEIAEEHRFFHWEIEFPDVAGFDATVGNPPWEIQKPNSREFFSAIDPIYRGYGKQEAIDKQKEYYALNADTEENWLSYLARLKSLSNFTKYAGIPFGDTRNAANSYILSFGKPEATEALHRKWQIRRNLHKGMADPKHPFLEQGSADVNTYKLFLEFSYRLLKPDGYLGFIVPSGVYTDRGSSELRKLFLAESRWKWLYSFENRKGIFASVDGRFKFCPVIVQKGGHTDSIRTAFMRHDLSDWEADNPRSMLLPVDRIQKFSPSSLSILEVNTEEDLRILTKIYENGVLLGDQSSQGWGIKYSREFDMTNDSKLFPPLPKWEANGYLPDEYGHWLKGNWKPNPDYPQHKNKRWIYPRPANTIYSRDYKQCILLNEIEDVALPLYEGRMIGQFDFSQKGWVSGKGRTAVWHELYFDGSVEDPQTKQPIPMYPQKMIEPQYLMGLRDLQVVQNIGIDNAIKQKASIDFQRIQTPKISYMRISSSTNSRTTIATFLDNYPAGDSIFYFKNTSYSPINAILVSSNLSYLSFDYQIRNKLGGLNMSEFVMIDTSLIKKMDDNRIISKIASLFLPYNGFSSIWNLLANKSAQSASSADYSIQNSSFKIPNSRIPWRGHWAITPHERLRLRCILDAVAANAYGLSYEDFAYILRDCDHPKEWLGTRGNSASLDPKGFWRVDKDKDPWLRHTVLSLVAYKDLLAKGLDAFLEQNDGEGWMLPTNVGTGLNVGTGRDQSLQYHNVYDLMGPRFYDWQLEQDIAESWAECTMHAENIRGILGLSGNVETRGGTSSNNDNASPTPTTPNTTEHLFPEMLEDDLFGKVDDGGKKKGKRKR